MTTRLRARSFADGAITAAKIATDAVGPSQINLGANYAFTGTVTGAGSNILEMFGGICDGRSFTVTSGTYTFENVTAARAGVDKARDGDGPDAGRIKAENALGAAMMNLFAVAENYPDLKADQNFQRLMAELSDIENKLAAARRFFNSATNEFNTAVQQFPANLFAGMFGFAEEPFFEIEENIKDAVNKAPDVKFD